MCLSFVGGDAGKEAGRCSSGWQVTFIFIIFGRPEIHSSSDSETSSHVICLLQPSGHSITPLKFILIFVAFVKCIPEWHNYLW